MLKRICLWSRNEQKMTPLALLLCLCMCLGLGACSGPSDRSCTCADCPCPPPIIWVLQPTQISAMGPAGMLAVKWIDITPKQFRFYFIFDAPKRSTLLMSANATMQSNPSSTTRLTSSVQVLGEIGSYMVGVMHVARTNRVGQIIDLQITPVSPTQASLSSWSLAPLKQVSQDWHADSAWYEFNGRNNALAEATWYGPVMEQLVSYVKVILPGQSVADRSYVFVRSDDPAKVSAITKAEYMAIAGAVNFTP
jgi:hypothetical protein